LKGIRDILFSYNYQTESPLIKIIKYKLSNIKEGKLSIILSSGKNVHFGKGKAHSIVKLQSNKTLLRFILNGNLGIADAYIRGEWSCTDLTTFFQIILKNEDNFKKNNKGTILYHYYNKLRHLLNVNSKYGAKKNISYHYDLGNKFYSLWLDKTMTYSSAIFKFKKGEDLEIGQNRKFKYIANAAKISKKDKVLEIGCGWGSFSQYVAIKYGCRVKGITLSKNQVTYVNDLFKYSKIKDLASVELLDYRDLNGKFDKIISIEMFEALGQENWKKYFDKIKNILKPGGCAVIQTIMIDDVRFTEYRKNVDFIQKYIFPGGLLPSFSEFSSAVAQSGLNLVHYKFFGSSYAKTCNIWNNQFQNSWEDINKLGFDIRFKRMWEYYLSYCEAGFKSESINVGIFKIVNN